jgi:hypothetical protein
MDNPLLKEIADAKEKFLNSNDQSVIGNWEKKAKEYLFIDSLKGHKGIQIILESFSKDIESINNLLLEAGSKDLSDKERDILIIKRNMCKKFINFFDESEKGLENIKKEIDELV